jgi:hypothetical protein
MSCFELITPRQRRMIQMAALIALQRHLKGRGLFV